MPHLPHRMGTEAERLGAAGTTSVRSLDANAKAAHQRITAEMGAEAQGSIQLHDVLVPGGVVRGDVRLANVRCLFQHHVEQ